MTGVWYDLQLDSGAYVEVLEHRLQQLCRLPTSPGAGFPAALVLALPIHPATLCRPASYLRWLNWHCTYSSFEGTCPYMMARCNFPALAWKGRVCSVLRDCSRFMPWTMQRALAVSESVYLPQTYPCACGCHSMGWGLLFLPTFPVRLRCSLLRSCTTQNMNCAIAVILYKS